jgi:protoporphyrinogen/coproporphyrinogen III oxidase
MTPSAQVIMVGGGISGLVCAYALSRAGVEALVLEAAQNVGGLIASESHDGFLLELGPQSFSGTAALRALCAELAITDQLLEAPASAPRYMLINGALRAVPLNPAGMLASSFLSSRTKWRLAQDALGSTRPPDNDESIAAFVRRKFSDELLDRLVGPFVSGIYAGDPERLSLRSAFPQLHEAEQSAGSVIRGMLRAAKSRKGPRDRPTLLSFQDGNQTLIRALARKIGANLRLRAEVVGINARRESRAVKFEVRVRQAGREETVVADRLVLATPADVAGTLLRDVNADFEPVLDGIEYAPVAVVSLGYRREDVGHSLDGFGFLVPRSSGLRTLGTVWNSSLFAGRAPAGHVLLTSFAGGATDPAATAFSGADLAQLVHREIAPVLQIRGAAVFSRAQIYRQALPQYNIGHAERLRALAKLRADLPGLFLIGNYRRGPAIGNCVDLAMETAAALVDQVRHV